MSTLSAASDLRIARAERGGGMTREQLERELADLNAISFGWALSCCRWDPEEARDVLQIAYLRALETAHAFNGDATARCWFFGIVRNTAAERRRARLVRGAALKRWLLREPAPPPEPSPEHLSHREQTGRLLRRLLLELSRRQREVLHLVFYEELTVEQAALVLGLPIGTARKHYQRGKLRLRRLLSEVQP